MAGETKLETISRIILAIVLAVGFSILLWRNRPASKPQQAPVINFTNAIQLGGTLVIASGIHTNDVVWNNTNVWYVTNMCPGLFREHWPFTELADPWKDMDPSEISQEEHARWLEDKRRFVLQEARVGFAEREALWEKLKEEYDKN